MQPVENQTSEQVFRKQAANLELSGTAQQIASLFNRLSIHQKLQVRHLTVNLIGQRVSQGHRLFKILVILASIVCLLPVLLFFSDKFRKKVSNLYSLPPTAYATLAQYIVQCSSLEEIDIVVRDNYINRSKTDILDKVITSLPFATCINFTNNCKAFDLEGFEYSRFPQNFPKIKESDRLTSNIRWSRYRQETRRNSKDAPNLLTRTRIVLPMTTDELRDNKI